MLQFLQTGKVLYILAAFCVAGVMSKLITGSLYKRLIKETANMALTKEKNLKLLKQRTDNMLLMNQSLRNSTAYIEKQLYGFRFSGISLDHWDNLSVQIMILCFLTGGATAFLAYWYRCDPYYMILYGSTGILSGLFMIFVESAADISSKRQQLSDCLVDYVENTPHFYKNVDKSQEKNMRQKKQETMAEVIPLKKEEPEETPADEIRESVTRLRESLGEIAAGRESGNREEEKTAAPVRERTGKELRPEEVKLLGDILREYLN